MLFTCINTASSKNNMLVRTKCDIIYDNVFERALLWGYETCQAQEMAGAAHLACTSITGQ